MMSVYGIQVGSRDDRFIQVAQNVMDAVSEAAKPGAWLVDMFPIRELLINFEKLNSCSISEWNHAVKHIPAWLPGAFYQRVAKQWSSDVHELRWAPFQVTKKHLVSGKTVTITLASY